jgi:hypothetical protein
VTLFSTSAPVIRDHGISEKPNRRSRMPDASITTTGLGSSNVRAENNTDEYNEP